MPAEKKSARTPKKPSLWKLGGLTPLRLVKTVRRELEEDEIAGRSAALAYYFVLAIFPAMIFVISLFGLLAAPGTQMEASLFANLEKMLPPSAFELVSNTLHSIIRASGAGKAVFGVLAALWAASGGISAAMDSLNIAYDVKETRPFWKRKLVAVSLTLALAFLMLLALGMLLFGGRVVDFIGAQVGLGAAAIFLWKFAQWPVALLFLLIAFALTYTVAPNLERHEWHWISPGAAIGVACWLLASFAIKVYLSFFNSYSKTYGSLGAVMVLLLWLYASGYSLLLGGEVNSEIEHATDTQNAMADRRERKDAEWKRA